MEILQVKDLQVTFNTQDGSIKAVNRLNFSVKAGDILGIVGESGSGKSQAVMSILGLLAKNAQTQGQVLFKDQQLLGLSNKQLNQIRGNQIAMIFQDPMTSINPYLRISTQMTEVLQVHRGMQRKAALALAIDMFEAVHIPEATTRIHFYPHQFSGGMRQRVMIAMALLCEPDILIADEPTTALDVTVQAQIMKLLLELKQKFGTTIILITHDLGVVAGVCDHVLVMYRGEMMEYGDVTSVFHYTQHPYTQGLLKSVPRLDQPQQALYAIPGQPAPANQHFAGCPFQERCEQALQHCQEYKPALRSITTGHQTACHLTQ